MTWAIEQTDVEVFSAARREQILERLFALRSSWIARGGEDFHTLGLALYQDARGAAASAATVAASNALLREHFTPALEDLGRYLQARLGAEVRCPEHLPLPGFHVLGRRSIPEGAARVSPHFDLQFRDAGHEAAEESEIVSVTVPIQLPAAGASLEYWPVDLGGLTILRRSGAVRDVEDVVRRYPARRVWYAPGRPCLQTGLPLHRIGPTPTVAPGDYRITLQCHGVLVDGAWSLYW